MAVELALGTDNLIYSIDSASRLNLNARHCTHLFCRVTPNWEGLIHALQSEATHSSVDPGFRADVAMSPIQPREGCHTWKVSVYSCPNSAFSPSSNA